MSALASAIATAIQKQEGYGQPAAVTLNANNNPGGLISWPGYPTVNGFAQFPDYETGFAAVVSNVQSKIDQGMTLNQLTQAWAPSGASNDPTGINNPSAYASFVSTQTGLPLDTPLNSLGSSTPGQTITMAQVPDFDSILSDLGLTSDSSDSVASTLPDPGTLLLIGLGGLLLWAVFRNS
jgi:hypothetical protein